MSNFFLITTPISETWEFNENTVMLGNWCKIYSQKENWKKLKNNKIIDYHWEDTNVLEKDYKYLNNLSDSIFKELVTILNDLHNVNYSSKFWYIIIGNWLHTFIHISYDRWKTVEKAFSDYNLYKTKIIKLNKNQMIPQSIENFIDLVYQDKWNHFFFSEIINFLNKPNFKIQYIDDQIKNDEFVRYKYYEDSIIKKLIYKFYSFMRICYSKIFPNEKHFCCETYLSKKNEFILNLKLNSLFLNFVPKVKIFSEPNFEIRNKINIKFNQSNEFEKFINKILPNFIPCSFIENFNFILKKTENLGWPKIPKTIFTSHAINTKTISSFYIASKKEMGSKLVHGQHGGGYGQCLIHWYEDFEKNISDKYVTWGWKEINNKNIINLGILKPLNKLKKLTNSKLKKNKLTMVIRPKERYFSGSLDSKIRGDQLLNYHKNCIKIGELLDENIRKKSLLIRLHERKYGWNEKEMWRDKFKDVMIDDGYSSINNTLKKSKLIIYTYNSTGYLEYLASNFPVLLFWPEKQNPLRHSAKNFFDKLKSVGIYHETPESVSNHINKVWENLYLWWNDENTQNIRLEFCKEFCKENTNIVNELKNLILNT